MSRRRVSRARRPSAATKELGSFGRARRFLLDDVANTIRLALVLLATVVGVVVVLLRSQILPRRFLLDAMQIQGIASGRLSSQGDDSFGNVAAIYRAAGLQDLPILAGLLGYGLAVLVLALVVVTARGRLNRLGTAAIMLTVLMSAVYLGAYSKDVFVLPVVALVLFMRRGLIGELVVVAGLLAYADLFRTYWYLVAGVFVLTRLAVRITNRRWVVLVAPPAALLVLALVMPIVVGHPSDFARTYVNETRSADSASTAIGSVVDWPEPLGSLVNTELVLLSAVVPVPLILRGGAYYLASSAVFLVVWAAFFIGAVRTGSHTLAMRGVVLVAAFVTAQALFEPDYGSLLRHLSPLLPIFCSIALARRAVDQRTDHS